MATLRATTIRHNLTILHPCLLKEGWCGQKGIEGALQASLVLRKWLYCGEQM